MLLRRDPSLRVFGLPGMDSVFPWDPIAEDFPDRVASELGVDFLDAWAREGWADEVPPEPPDPRPPAPRPAETVPEPSEGEAGAARQEVIAAEEESRAADEKVKACEERGRTAAAEARAARIRLEAAAGASAAARLVLEETEAGTKAALRELEEAERAAASARDKLPAAQAQMLVLTRRRRKKRAERKAREAAGWLETTRREEERASAEMRVKEAVLGQALAEMEQSRKAAAQARERLVRARRRLRRLTAPRREPTAAGAPDPKAAYLTYPYLFLVREMQVLGSLSWQEWSRRATGHGSAPRFILELPGEAIWLYKGEWFTAEPKLRQDDIMVLMDDTVRPAMPPEMVSLVWERYRGRCARCQGTANLEIDHIVPLALGGRTAPGNLQLLCSNCSREKSHNL